MQQIGSQTGQFGLPYREPAGKEHLLEIPPWERWVREGVGKRSVVFRAVEGGDGFPFVCTILVANNSRADTTMEASGACPQEAFSNALTKLREKIG